MSGVVTSRTVLRGLLPDGEALSRAHSARQTIET